MFCGTCSVESKLTIFDRIILNDNHKYLIELLKAVQKGYVPPTIVTEEQYKYVKEHKDEDPALTGFVGIACSFGGKWFAGYARNYCGRNYAREGKDSLLRDMRTLMNAELLCEDYQNVLLPDGCVVYADPPYKDTTNYRNIKFDSDMFWQYARNVSLSGHLMYISEQTAPIDFIPIWQKTITRTLDYNKSNQFKATEKLFIHKCFQERVEYALQNS